MNVSLSGYRIGVMTKEICWNNGAYTDTADALPAGGEQREKGGSYDFKAFP
jgi:hypothetical protein